MGSRRAHSKFAADTLLIDVMARMARRSNSLVKHHYPLGDRRLPKRLVRSSKGAAIPPVVSQKGMNPAFPRET
jgi:hypothetical protein